MVSWGSPFGYFQLTCSWKKLSISLSCWLFMWFRRNGVPGDLTSALCEQMREWRTGSRQSSPHCYEKGKRIRMFCFSSVTWVLAISPSLAGWRPYHLEEVLKMTACLLTWYRCCSGPCKNAVIGPLFAQLLWVGLLCLQIWQARRKSICLHLHPEVLGASVMNCGNCFCPEVRF